MFLLYIVCAAGLVDQRPTVVVMSKEKIYNISHTARFSKIARKILRPTTIYKAELSQDHE